ncbi:Tetratricopeptide repeat-containing protein, partial [Candidatus Electrothrix aarhusensis]
MNNQFESKDEEAAGKQEKVKQKLRWLRSHPEVTWSGAGIYVVSLIVAAGIALASWHFWPEASPPPKQNSASTTGGNAAATNADQAKLQEVQLRYAKAAEYWQKAAALLPEGEKKDRAYYLNEAGYDLDRISRYREALPLYEQSLALYQEINDQAGEGTTLNNIGLIYHARGEYDKALKYLEQSLEIHREIGNRAVEGTTLNNISQIYDARSDYDKALKYLEQSLEISQNIGDRAGEGVTLNNIGQIYKARGEY